MYRRGERDHEAHFDLMFWTDAIETIRMDYPRDNRAPVRKYSPPAQFITSPIHHIHYYRQHY